jgi:hypothetical protein
MPGIQRRLGRSALRQDARILKVIRAIRILDKWVPSDEPSAIILVRSLRGFKGVRVAGSYRGCRWSVTLYGGNFYLVEVDGRETVPFNMPLHVVNFINATINLTHGRRR